MLQSRFFYIANMSLNVFREIKFFFKFTTLNYYEVSSDTMFISYAQKTENCTYRNVLFEVNKCLITRTLCHIYTGRN